MVKCDQQYTVDGAVVDYT